MAHDVVAIARGWIGTPYHHQASVKGAGSDCLGLIRGIWRDLNGGCEPEQAPPYTADWGEIGGQEVLMQGALRHLHPVPATAPDMPGEVLLFRMRQGAIAKHLGILARTGPAASFVHAYERHGVIESPLSGPWRARIAARFRFPETN
ncbi:MAG: peptidase [Paracoccus sp. (in: a-proteobacteria)]|uniref:peptidase n=1 Tax=Paracoccus sp. TaxID=267 RepID=UPI0026DFCE33|nr:peptidase [Paracoccus sp. (in: a-proteobacteria)]MDO5613863.1 peptidase [Paracoccus sp. (in: a-proteobacteria)]